MAKPRQTKAGNWELCLSHKLLPSRVYRTFDTEADALAFDAEAQKFLAAGVVPASLAQATKRGNMTAEAMPLTRLFLMWQNTGQPSRTDNNLLEWLGSDEKIKDATTSSLTYAWCEAWVKHLKMDRNMAPSSIRQRVQAVSRAIDWFLRTHPETQFINPFKLLPRGYSIYSASEARALQADGKDAKHDVVRERRLLAGEEDRIVAALSGVKREGRERALSGPHPEMFKALFLFILHTGVRMREAYTVMRENIDLATKTVKIKTTKQRNGKVVFRDVPIRPELFAVLQPLVSENPTGILFPFWDGTTDVDELDKLSHKLSARFASLFRYAGCDDFTEHDLRHEATCRWFESRGRDGQWLFRPEEINRLMGWAPNSTMAARYASFRVESLADRLWS